MWQKIKDNLLGLVALAFGLLTAAFVYERDSKEKAEAKLDTAKATAEDAVLVQQQTDDQKQIEELQKSESVPNPTAPPEVLDKLNNL